MDPLLIPAFALGFAALWCFILWIIASVGGWARLADYYGAAAEYDGPRRRFQSLALERLRGVPVAVNNVAEIGVEGPYLRLSMFALFRPFHPPLRIPFSSLSVHERTGFLGRRVELAPASAPAIRIVVPHALARWIAENSGGLLEIGP